MKKQQFEMSIDNELLKGAKEALNACLQVAVRQAIKTGSDEGSATLKIHFLIPKILNKETDEWEMKPDIKYKAGYSVPMKDSIDGDVIERSTLTLGEDGKYILMNDQISMDELLDGDDE